MPNSNTGGTPDFPDVVGFELPSVELRDAHGEDQVAVVLLNTAPSREWITTFFNQAEAFKAQYRLADVRVLGTHITLIGNLGDARALTANAKLLVQNTSQLRMRDRMGYRNDARTGSNTDPHGRDVLREDDERMRDVAVVAAIPSVQQLLSEVIRLTGMRFAAIARVTDTRWTTCAVYDLLDFGLKPGQDLVLESTICNEIRQQPRTIALEQASQHSVFKHHHTPSLYGFESYISVPIWTSQGSFFGTLCALDPKPAVLDATTVSAIEAFARSIGSQLPGMEDTTAV